MSFCLSQGEQGDGFYKCLYLACCPSTYRKVKTGWFSHMCVLGFPLVISSYLSQGEKRVLPTYSVLYIFRKMNGSLTYVLSRLSPSQQSCLPTYRKVQRGGSNTCLYLAFPLEGEARGGFYRCLYLAGFVLSCFSTYHKIKRG